MKDKDTVLSMVYTVLFIIEMIFVILIFHQTVNMIALEFIGTITEDAQIITTVDNKKEITFPVDVKRGIDKNGLDKSIVIYCKKKGTCSSDKRLVRDQKIFIRGDINASLKRVCTGVNRAVIECVIWQFELL